MTLQSTFSFAAWGYTGLQT